MEDTMKALFLLSFLVLAYDDRSYSGYDNYSYADTPRYTHENSYDTGYDYGDASASWEVGDPQESPPCAGFFVVLLSCSLN